MSVRDAAPPKRLIVSLHDVAPPFEDEIRRQIEALKIAGVDRYVLKVVPDWHGSYPLSRAPWLVRLLQHSHETGSELVLHGLRHQAPGTVRGPLLLRIRAALFARHASEFARLTPEEAHRAVQRGVQIFSDAGLPAPSAFCAPGWLLAPDLRPALRQAGIRHLIGMLAMEDLVSGTKWRTPSSGYMGASRPHEEGARLGSALLRRTMPDVPVFKLYLHPQGAMDGPGVRRVVALAERLVAGGWVPSTYEDLVSVPISEGMPAGGDVVRRQKEKRLTPGAPRSGEQVAPGAPGMEETGDDVGLGRHPGA